jgi:hypothetical protein
MREVCNNLPFYREHEGKRYYVLHLPAKDKPDDFRPVLQAKLDDKDYDFRGV